MYILKNPLTKNEQNCVCKIDYTQDYFRSRLSIVSLDYYDCIRLFLLLGDPESEIEDSFPFAFLSTT